MEGNLHQVVEPGRCLSIIYDLPGAELHALIALHLVITPVLGIDKHIGSNYFELLKQK